MKNNNAIVLLGTMLKSTSVFNTIKYTKDKKKKSKAIGGLVGYFFIYLMLFAFCVLTAVGYGISGFAYSIPSMTVMYVTVMSLVFTVLRANGYLFNFKEYDMLMAMPFETKTVVACKFLYMYIKSFPIYGIISLSMMVGYGLYVKPMFYIYLMWILMSLLIPLIPMVIASAIGALLARTTSGFRYKKIIQAILTFILLFIAMFSRFIIEYFARTSTVENVVGTVKDKTAAFKQFYFPALWFEDAIVDRSFLQMIAFVVVSIGLFVLFFNLVSKSYIKINSRLGSHAKSKKAKPLTFKSKSIAKTIAYKEVKRMLGSVPYLTNAGFGIVFVILTSVVALFINGDKYLQQMETATGFFTKDMIISIVPLTIFFFIGMVATTACTPSLEGKNYWILQSMPISHREIYHGKMLFNLYLTLPAAIISTVCFGICFRAGVVYTLFMLICEVALVLYSTTFGMVCGLKFMKLDWENDIEVVKQSTGVTVYLLPNMFITMALIGIQIALRMNGMIYMLIITIVYLMVSAICYSVAMRMKML